MFLKSTLVHLHLSLKPCHGFPAPLAGIITKLPQPTRACLVCEHGLSFSLPAYSETLCLGLVFLESTKFIARAFALGRSAAAEAAALWVSCIVLHYHSLSVCPLLSAAPLPCCCGHPDLGISFLTATTDSSSCCEGQQLSALSCQPCGNVRSPSPKVVPLPCTTHRQSGPAPSS